MIKIARSPLLGSPPAARLLRSCHLFTPAAEKDQRTRRGGWGGEGEGKKKNREKFRGEPEDTVSATKQDNPVLVIAILGSWQTHKHIQLRHQTSQVNKNGGSVSSGNSAAPLRLVYHSL